MNNIVIGESYKLIGDLDTITLDVSIRNVLNDGYRTQDRIVKVVYKDGQDIKLSNGWWVEAKYLQPIKRVIKYNIDYTKRERKQEN